MRHLARIGTMTIASGQTNSNTLTSRLGFGSASDIVVYTPDTLPETVTLYATGDDSALTDFCAINVAGSDLTLGVNKAVVVPTASFGCLRATAGSAVAADRVFLVFAQMDC